MIHKPFVIIDFCSMVASILSCYICSVDIPSIYHISIRYKWMLPISGQKTIEENTRSGGRRVPTAFGVSIEIVSEHKHTETGMVITVLSQPYADLCYENY